MHAELSSQPHSTCAVRWLHISAAHPALPGHFPGRPVVPGVVLLAQVQQLLNEHVIGWQLRALPTVKFLRPVLPDQPILLCLELLPATHDPTVTTSSSARFAIRSVGESPAVIAQGQLSLRATSGAATARDARS